MHPNISHELLAKAKPAMMTLHHFSWSVQILAASQWL
jgi:hypothetical protein